MLGTRPAYIAPPSDWEIMDTIYIGFDDNGELVDVTPTEPESMDTVVISAGRKVPFRW